MRTPLLNDRGSRTRRNVKLIALTCAAAGMALASYSSTIVAREASAATLIEESPPFLEPAAPATFSHVHPNHARLQCLMCHSREGNAVRPKLPGHMPCAGCHSQQFKNPSAPLCTICHTDPATGATKDFPRLKTFDARFDHAVHSRGAARPANGCATCHHSTGRNSVAISIPSRFDAHSTCFQCHTPVGSSRVDLQACKLEYSIVSPK